MLVVGQLYVGCGTAFMVKGRPHMFENACFATKFGKPTQTNFSYDMCLALRSLVSRSVPVSFGFKLFVSNSNRKRRFEALHSHRLGLESKTAVLYPVKAGPILTLRSSKLSTCQG